MNAKEVIFYNIIDYCKNYQIIFYQSYRPINPKSFPIYYGWLLVPMAAIGVFMSMPGQTAGFSTFTEPLMQLAGFSRTQLTLVYLIGTITSGFLLPMMGTLLDRWGSRNMMIFSSVMMGITLFWLSYLDRIAALFQFLPSLIVYLILITIGIFSLRFFGQGLLTITANTMIRKWFDKKRGRTIAIMGVVNSIAFSSTPAIMAAFVTMLAWNGAWRVMSLVIGVGMGLIAWIFYRNTPEECWLVVDGADLRITPVLTESELRNKRENTYENGSREKGVYGLTRGQAIRTRSFWAIVLVLSTNALVITGLTFHIQAIGMQAGLSLTKAVAMFIPVSFIVVPVSFLSAMLSDRIHARWFVYLMAGSQCISYTAIYFLNTSIGYVVSIIFLGISGGLMGPTQTAIIPKIFGRLHLGSLNGIITSTMVRMSALGPMLLSMVNDITGSLRTGVTLMIVFPVVTLVFSFRMPERFVD